MFQFKKKERETRNIEGNEFRLIPSAWFKLYHFSESG